MLYSGGNRIVHAEITRLLQHREEFWRFGVLEQTVQHEGCAEALEVNMRIIPDSAKPRLISFNR